MRLSKGYNACFIQFFKKRILGDRIFNFLDFWTLTVICTMKTTFFGKPFNLCFVDNEHSFLKHISDHL